MKSIITKVAVLGLSVLTCAAAHASMEDLSDYSEFGSAYDDWIDYPAQESQAEFPEFSWDTIPRWIICRSDKQVSDDAVNRIANHYQVVVMEKANNQGFDYTEYGAADFAGRLKAANPDITNIQYWNTRIRWGGYYANMEFDQNDDWVDWPRTEADSGGMGRTFYEHDAAGMREWWQRSILDLVENNDDIDGVFLDTIEKFYDGSVLDENGDPKNTYIQTIDDLNKAIPNKVLVYNGLQNGNPDGCRNYLQLTDGVYEEATMDPNEDQTVADAFAVAIQMYREAAAKGKLVLWRGSDGHQTYFTGEEEPSGYDEEGIALREDYFERNVYFTLALYLMFAEKYSYFGYSGGDYMGTGENGWNIWDTSYMDIFDKPLGEPLGGPVREGYVYSRSFKYLDVSINLETGDTTFDWKDPSDVTSDPIVSISSPAYGTTLNSGTITVDAMASELNGSIAKVEFYQDRFQIGEDTTSPYSCSWEQVPAGGYSLTAKATDNRGNVSVSQPIRVIVDATSGIELIDAVTVAASEPADAGNLNGDYLVRERAADNALLNRHISAFFNVDVSAISSFDPDAGDYVSITLELNTRLNTSAASALMVGQITGGAWDSSSLPQYAWATDSAASAGPGSQIREGTIINNVATASLGETYTVDITDIVDAWINGGEPNDGLGIYLTNGDQGVGFNAVKFSGSWGNGNLALGKSASQSSSVSFGGAPSLAIDGDTNGRFWDHSVTHTSNETQPWWEVDLGANMYVRDVVLYNRTDSNMNRLSDFTVSLINSSGSTVWSETFSDYPNPSLAVNVGGEVGRTIRVQLNGTGVLSLAEVQVRGSKNPIVNIRKRNAMGYAIDGNWGGFEGQDVYLYAYNAENINQQWEEVDCGDGYYAYQKLGTAFSLDGSAGGALEQNVALGATDQNDFDQQWKKVDMGNGYYQLRKRNALGYCIDGGSGGANKQSIELWSSSTSSYNLHWKFEY